MKAVCPLHGPTTIVGTNAYGFPVYACCRDDIPFVMPPDACTREPVRSADEPAPKPRQPPADKEPR